ncbi:hypothetical protein [Lacicoccus alkaliphilus]|uniref:Uncharacterized protein n=1 Tax=Lacicoccus alkaliphilus DSM 16010 TaxID=1123231 RepID=A0A1M7G1B4_9BACL|nr:hypothetical protein [Salinicoccus alkaliphilus]SHM09679.1 hypothetical protein SAMN02745189_01539 [Salinicoccus alkaliphilus DSM 16010]
MYSLLDILVCFLIGIGLIFLFKLQREISPGTYFATSGILSEIEDEQPDRRAILIRICIIILYGVALGFFIDSSELIVYGMTLGTFLIVWPVFINDENIKPKFLKHKFLLRAFLLVFILITFFSAKLSVIIYNLVQEIAWVYFNNFDSERMIGIIGDSLFWLILVIGFRWFYNYIQNRLSEKVSFTQSQDYNEAEEYEMEYEEDDDDELEEYAYELAEEERIDDR